MSRPFRARVLAALLVAAAAGCQDYNFNPVGQCLIQPGSERVSLSNISTADVLFVVDESGSMGGEQVALASNFDAFVNNLNQANVDRANRGLDAIDFHLAVTTSSVFWNEQTTGTCRTDCPGAVGQAVCCSSGNAPEKKPQRCAGPGAACPTTPTETSCRLDCNGLSGEFHCCASDGSFPANALTELVPCSRVGTMCGGLLTHYDIRGVCENRIATNEWPYPQGDFVSVKSSAVPGFSGKPGPRVVHFDKEVYPIARACTSGGGECASGEVCVVPTEPPGETNGVCRKTCTASPDSCTGFFKCVAGACQPTNRQKFTGAELIQLFQENVRVGTCGSGQEQALQGGRLALQKAFSGQQRDTYDAAGAFKATPPTDPVTQLPGSAPARWPNENSKIVLVFVGDEDDCSSPQDPSGGVVMLSGQGPAVDACSRDGVATTDPAEQAIRNKQFPVSDFVSYFTNLGRPVAAGFILPAAQNSCTLDSCSTSGLCCGAGACDSVNGAQAPGHRLLAAAKALSQAGAEVVAGSICDGNFGTILDSIAEIVKPPETLTLPSEPAESQIALLRIVDANGVTRKLCGPPLPPRPAPNYDLAGARATGKDWWFTVSDTAAPPYDPEGNSTVSIPSRYVYINPAGNCRANPGETYSADYLGVVPPEGCVPTAGDLDGSIDCRNKLGGSEGAFVCYVPAGLSRGTCTCKPSN
jgi:hypothetical protein